MAPIILNGKTLGEKHRYYNQLLVKATETFQKLDNIDYDDPDIDNLFKIDIACHQRDVQYILSVLKCEDMLYVSRAIKNSKWLIIDNIYADIINPQCLYTELFPQMTSKAKCKLMLHIRMLLKDEKRVEQFFDFLKEHDLQSALKWLPNCSNSFVESIIKAHSRDIPLRLLKRLCEKSITFLDLYCQDHNNYSYHNLVLQSSTFWLQKHLENYLSIFEKSLKKGNYVLSLSCKATKEIMKNCPERILENLEMYLNHVDIPTLVKFMNEEEIEDFIKTYKEKENFTRIFDFQNLQHFLKRLPVDKRLDFITFVNKEYINKRARRNNQNISKCYNIYQLAPFDIAMVDLKKLIQAESDPNERKEILNILLICAGNNREHIQSLINYYHSNHINEPYKFKIQFVNSIIRNKKIVEYGENTWAQINDLFISMEVYEESNQNVQECVKAIILYNVLHNEVVPDIIEKKFEFGTFGSIQKHLEGDTREKLFSYLYNFLFTKLNSCNIINESGFTEPALVLGNVLRLMIDWNKNLNDYPIVINKIRQLIQIKRDRALLLPLSNYCLKKPVRRIFFEESILLNPTEEACINALKHDPQLLDLCNNDVLSIYLNDTIILKRLLSKIRIYWSHSMARQLKTLYFEKLKHKTNYKAAVSGLCILLAPKESQEFVNKYAPSSDKINWSQLDDRIAIQRNLGKRLHLARPQLPLAVALLYARGDYLQYALPSINTLLYNINETQIRLQIKKMLNAPVSLQKHGIRIAVKKLPYIEITKIFSQKWNSTKNKSIRSNIFKQTFIMLCTEKDPSIAQEIWKVLSTFIDELTIQEDKNIYITLSNVHLVPLPVKVCYWIKSYYFLKSLPEKTNCSHLYKKVKCNVNKIVEFLSVDSAADVFSDFFSDEININKNAENLALYLLSTKCDKIQHGRYEKVFLPILEKALTFRNDQNKNHFNYRCKINIVVESLINRVCNIIGHMIMPIALFSNILQWLEKAIPVTENYILFTKLKLALSYVQILDTIIKEKKVNLQEKEFNENYYDLYPQTIPKFSKAVIKCLKEDVSYKYSSIYLHFSDALSYVMNVYAKGYDRSKTCQTLVESDDSIEIQLVVLRILPNNIIWCNDDEHKALKMEILNKIRQHPSNEVNMHYWRYIYE